ncbi:MAG TPA: pilus assembly protein N-terminal domain-containing protein [Bryobacteraceae bacterium]|nr:pilus assembly protein N-terminal domain-containing protein [Bryobacteraceae bacterium]
MTAQDAVLSSALALALFVGLTATNRAPAETLPPHPITLTVGRGDLLQFDREIVKVVVAEPKIADAIVVSPHEVMVTAKGNGKTTLIIWQADVAPARYDIDVVPDSAEQDALKVSLTRELKAALPDAAINFAGNGETIVLTGTAQNPGQSQRAAAVASTHTRKVVDLIQVPPPPAPRQILLQVKFADVNRTAMQQLGFNLFSTNGKLMGVSSTEQFQAPRFSQLNMQNGTLPSSSVNFADLLNLFVFNPSLNLGATIEALQTHNLMQILAEPNLIVTEGKTASFLAGGQFPFPTITATTTGGAIAPVITVQFKKFGVQLDFTPEITPQGAIHLTVKPEVSSLDFSNAVTLQGFLIPALDTRSAETEVELKDGESFAIAGLIDNRVQQVLNKVRGVGDIPIIGNLFRSRSTEKTSDELLVVITPHFVKPLANGEHAKLPDTPEPFMPTVAEEKAAADAKKKKKDPQPQFVGPRGHQEPN